MRIDSGPPVPAAACCTCQVPIWVTQLNYWKGWNETVCRRCRRHGFWGNDWARLYPYKSRAEILKLEGVTND